MPVRDGILATLEITKKDSEAKIIIVSSIGTQKQLTAAVQAGAIDFVQKPVKDELIQQILDKYLGGE